MLTPFRNRKLTMAKPVKVYRNLHKNTYSITQEGRVVAHGADFTLRDCSFQVQEAGRQRVLRTKQKNVHAFVKGFIEYSELYNRVKQAKPNLRYNPYESDGFMYGRDKLSGAARVSFKRSGLVVEGGWL